MLLTIGTTHTPATDLGYLLHKNPARAQQLALGYGTAHVFYPEASDAGCTAALFVDIDAVALVRERRGPEGDGGLLTQYVNDRPYAASSFLSVAIANAFGTAMAGRSKERPELAATAIPLVATVSVVSCPEGETFLRRLFEPLGYTVTLEPHRIDGAIDQTEAPRYFTLTLSATKRVAELLAHLYVLIPVLDDEKHYWVGDDEVEKLLRHGEGWLASHPARELITRRYLRHQRSLTREAVARLVVQEEPNQEERADVESRDAGERALERPLSLHEHRLGIVTETLRHIGATSVVDLGCGEGRLLRLLLEDRRFTRITGMDVSHRALEIATDRLQLDRMAPMQRERLTMLHGSLVYRDARLAGFDAAAVVEVIEHLDPQRLAAFERVVFEFARPRAVVITTPNAEYNVRWPALPAGKFRHPDHRFEWTRPQFETWASGVGERFGYHAEFHGVGPADPEVGAPTQMAVFTRSSDTQSAGEAQ